MKRKKYNSTWKGQPTKRVLARKRMGAKICVAVFLIMGCIQAMTMTNDVQILAGESEEAPPSKPLLVEEPQELKEKAENDNTPKGIKDEVREHIIKEIASKGLDFGLNNNVISLVDEWSKFYGYTDTQKAKAIISCEGKNDAGVCNYEYGCAGGLGHFQWIPSSWISICQAELGLTDRSDSSQNIQCGIYTLQKYGDSHWGLKPTVENPDGSWWGSRRCFEPKLIQLI